MQFTGGKRIYNIHFAIASFKPCYHKTIWGFSSPLLCIMHLTRGVLMDPNVF